MSRTLWCRPRCVEQSAPVRFLNSMITNLLPIAEVTLESCLFLKLSHPAYVTCSTRVYFI